MRPHVEFVHQHRLAWAPGFLTGTEERVLSRDPDTGADSVVVSFPADWAQAGPRRLAAAEELFLLAGELTIDGVHYGPMCYGRWPEGSLVTAAASGSGAVAVLFRNRGPELEPPPRADRRKLVDKIELLRAAPAPMRTPDFPNPEGVRRIDLFDDPDTGEATWVLAGPALRAGRKPEVHPVVEEMFLVAGEMHSPLGVMLPGAYFWRPADVWHGPFSTISGCVSLFRTQGGPLRTRYAAQPVEPAWYADDVSTVPAQLRVVAPASSPLDRWRGTGGVLG